MTESALAKIKFKCVSHLAMEQEHVLAHESVGHIPQILIFIHTPVRKDGSFGRQYRHYSFIGKVYKSKKKFLEAATAFEEECKSKFKKI